MKEYEELTQNIMDEAESHPGILRREDDDLA